MNQRLLPRQTQLAHILLNRLEKISADSPWAHQASGVRASIAKILSGSNPAHHSLDKLMEQGFEILEKAAEEIPED